MLGEALVSDVILAANGTWIFVGIRNDAIADIVAFRAKNTDNVLRAAELIVCRANNPTLPLMVDDALAIDVAVADSGSLPLIAERAADIADVVARISWNALAAPRAAELMVARANSPTLPLGDDVAFVIAVAVARNAAWPVMTVCDEAMAVIVAWISLKALIPPFAAEFTVARASGP